jgi:1-acyl-sn-glycerol-3-phosphate acyltransferase
MFARRLVSIPLLLVGTLALAALAPALAVLAAVVDAFRGTSALRALAFALVLCALECAGVLAAAALTFAGPEPHYRLQRWWATSLARALTRLFALRVEVGGDPLPEAPFLLLPRHVSMADTVLPVLLVTAPRDLHPRYVLKAELLWDPCLDVVGNRLPNAFVRRGTGDAAEVAKIAQLARDLGPRDVVVLFPEGTRFTEARRARLLEREPRAGRFARVLPPRAGGVEAALGDLDVVLLAHSGLDRVTRLGDLVRGDLVGASVTATFRHVRRRDIGDVRAWLDEAWTWVDTTVDAPPPAR